jgi:hypothetical protein
MRSSRRSQVTDQTPQAHSTQPARVGHQLRQPHEVHLRQPQHDQRPAVVAGRGEERLGLAQQKCLLLGLVTNEQHRDVGPDQPRLARPALRVGPHEALVAHPEVKAVAVNLLHVRQGECEPTNVVGVSHRGGS